MSSSTEVAPNAKWHFDCTRNEQTELRNANDELAYFDSIRFGAQNSGHGVGTWSYAMPWKEQ